MKYADLNCGDYFKLNDRVYIVCNTFSGNKISFRIDPKDCGHKCIFNGTDEVEYISTYEYNNPYLSNVGGRCRLDSAPMGQPLYAGETDEYIIKFTMSLAFFVSGERAGLITVVNVENPYVEIVDHVYVKYAEGIRYEI